MAKTVTIIFSDAEFETLQKAYAAPKHHNVNEAPSESDVTVDYVKNDLINMLSKKIRLYDEIEARKKAITFTSFDPS